MPLSSVCCVSQDSITVLGGEWGAFIETAKELAELVFNPETSGAGVDMDRNKELLKSFRIPFLSLAAKAQTLSD